MSGATEPMRGLVVFSAIVVTVAPMALGQETAAANCTLSQVLATRAKVQEGSATFTQERRIHYVRDPLSSAGRLRFVAPDHLEMIVEKPQPESFIYDDGVLSFDTADGKPAGQVSVDSDLLLSAMFSGLVGTLSGNEDELRHAFFIEFVAEACNWRMSLTPKSKRVSEKVQKIDLKGRDQHLDEVEILQANGDRSLLRIMEQQ
jgi:Outer membrane lipoprotein carrier protein LolA-like